MADIKEAEGTESLGTSIRRKHAGAELGMEWDGAIEAAFEEFRLGERKIVQLVSIH